MTDRRKRLGPADPGEALRDDLMSDFQMSDALTDAERRFPIDTLLECEYFQKYRRGYYESLESNLLNHCRNYITLLTSLAEIHNYNKQHAKSFAKRFRENAKDFKNCEAIFAEVIVYHHYIRAAHENLIRNIDLHASEADIIVERSDRSKMFLEVFSINPEFPTGTREKPIVNDVKTHTQDAMASIRQKLLRKIKKQKQLSAPRENYAVIELNDMSIAGDFSVLSSLSGGYKVRLDKTTLRQVWAGYDWRDSIFDDPATRFLTGVIYFNRGDYSSRKFLFNPQVATTSRAHPRREAFDMEKFLSNPNPKIFDPKKVVTASELFDVDEFVRTIHEGRDVALKDSQE